MPPATSTEQKEPNGPAIMPGSREKRKKVILWSGIVLLGLALALFLMAKGDSVLHVEKLTDLKSHEIRIESAHLVVIPAGRFIVVRMLPPANRLLALLRPGQKLYIFAENGKLTETIENDFDDETSHFDLEESKSSRLIPRDQLAEMLTADPVKLESICAKIVFPVAPSS